MKKELCGCAWGVFEEQGHQIQGCYRKVTSWEREAGTRSALQNLILLSCKQLAKLSVSQMGRDRSSRGLGTRSHP